MVFLQTKGIKSVFCCFFFSDLGGKECHFFCRLRVKSVIFFFADLAGKECGIFADADLGERSVTFLLIFVCKS